MEQQFTYDSVDDTEANDNQTLPVVESGLVARGDDYLDEHEDAGLKSALPGVSDECWTQFVKALMTADANSVSKSNALGVFELMPRRLADLGVVRRLKRGKSPEGRTIYVAVFVPPMTCDRFLRSPQAQYRVFCKSMVDYDNRMSKGEIVRGDVSRSGALALLHRAGPNALQTWKSGEQFSGTKKIYDKCAGIF